MTIAGEPRRAERAGSTTSDRREHVVMIATVVVAIVPIVVATARALLHDWYPISDNGITAIRTADVFSATHFPWWGQASSASLAAAHPLNHPGPLQFLLLSVPATIFGSAFGLAIGTAMINAGAIIVCAWVAWRRAGTVACVLAALVGTAISWSMGSELLFDPWPAHAVMLPTLAVLFLAWGIADGDLVMLPLGVFVGSFLVQTHLTAAYLVPLVLGVGVVAGWRRVRGVRRVAVLGIAVLVGVVLWLPPLIEELASDSGNISRLVEEVRDPPEHVVGREGALRLSAEVAAYPPFWLRDSMADSLRRSGGTVKDTAPSVEALPVVSTAGAVLGLGVAMTLLAVVAFIAWRRRDRTVIVLELVAGLGLVIAWYTASQVTTQIVGVAPHQFRFLWPIATFVTYGIVLGLLRCIPRDGSRRVVWLTGGLTLAVAVAAAPAADAAGGPQADEWAIPVVRAIDAQLGSVRPDAPILADWSGIAFQEPFSSAFTAALEDRGIPFVVESPFLVRQFGNARRYNGENARSRIFYRQGDAARAHHIGEFRRVAFHEGLDGSDRRQLRAARATVVQLLQRGEIEPTVGLRSAWQSGIFLELRGPFADAAAARRVVASRVLIAAWERGLLRVPRRFRHIIARYSRLQTEADRATLGVFVGPISAVVPGASA